MNSLYQCPIHFLGIPNEMYNGNQFEIHFLFVTEQYLLNCLYQHSHIPSTITVCKYKTKTCDSIRGKADAIFDTDTSSHIETMVHSVSYFEASSIVARRGYIKRQLRVFSRRNKTTTKYIYRLRWRSEEAILRRMTKIAPFSEECPPHKS